MFRKWLKLLTYFIWECLLSRSNLFLIGLSISYTCNVTHVPPFLADVTKKMRQNLINFHTSLFGFANMKTKLNFIMEYYSCLPIFGAFTQTFVSFLIVIYPYSYPDFIQVGLILTLFEKTGSFW